MIPIPCKDDMERLGLGERLKFLEVEELTEEQARKFIEHYGNIKNLNASITIAIADDEADRV